jgi:plastocyanin
MNRTRLARLLRFVLLAPLMLLIAPPALAATHAITISNSTFSPTSMSVRPGDTITWTNNDTPPHDVTVTSGPITFKSPMLTPGQSWSYTVRTAGSYSYICSVHPYMRATLTVTAAAAPAGRPASAALSAQASRAAAGVTAAAVPATPLPTAPLSTAARLQQQTVAPAAETTSSKNVNANLLIAGLVVGVATLCLLLLGSSALSGKGVAARPPSRATVEHKD